MHSILACLVILMVTVAGWGTEVVEESWLYLFPEEVDPEYHTYEEYIAELQLLADTYPNLCKLDSIGRAQQFPRTIWCLKISDNPQIEEDELSVIYTGLHHACELMGGETLLYMMEHWLENYGLDSTITGWINNYEVFFVPLLNPDGHYAVMSGITEWWRKNARDIDNDSLFYEFTGNLHAIDSCEGIDLNRNYDWHWIEGGSPDPWVWNYRGNAPFSESETQAIRDLAEAQRFVTGLSIHSNGEWVFRPWDLYGDNSPDEDVFTTFGQALANRFIGDDSTGYSFGYTAGNQGMFENYLYGKYCTLTFCVETLPIPLVIPPGNELPARTALYYQGAIYLMERLTGSGVTGHITDAESGQPVIARIEVADRISDAVEPRYNEPLYGRYTRILNPGTYMLLAMAEDYDTARVIVNIADTMEYLDIEMTPTGTGLLNRAIAVDYRIELHCSPNPFNNSITITFTVPDASPLELAVYDCAGRRVRDLGFGIWDLGENKAVWNAEGCGSGIYFITLEGENIRHTKKVVLLK